MSAPVEGNVTSAEPAVRRLWSSHGLPPASGILGQGTGPVLRQLVGTYTPGDPPVWVAQRAVAADVDARAEALAGGRSFATLRRQGWAAGVADPVVAPLLGALGVWVGGGEGRPYDAVDRTAGVRTIAGRLARLGLLVARDGPVRVCPSCATPRSPERTVYHEEVGETLLVRFPLEPGPDGAVLEALAWVDAPWRLLGTTALLVNPELPYVTVEYRRGEVVARLLTLRSSLERLKSWLSGVELKVVEERPGRAYDGRRYIYPLRHEFPDGASLPAPSGALHAVAEVGDSGTGVVPLVPGHGGTDAQIAERIGVQGWPLLTLQGTFDLALMHKYSGLDLETTSEFVARDLTEAGSVLARLRVLRGVPYCGSCGHPLVWLPGRCWCLDPGRLPAEQLARYGQILPDGRPVTELEVTNWPVSDITESDAPDSVPLLECDRCSRLDAPDGPLACPCGGKRRSVSRRLGPSVTGAFAAWSRNDPVPAGDPVRLYLGERRRAPAVVHQLAAMAAVDARGAEVRATILPTLTDVDLVGLVAEHGADAVRAAFVRTGRSEGPGGSFVERCRQEDRRLAGLARLATEVAALSETPVPGGPAGLAGDRELEAEDRALLARWAATEVRALAAYDELRPEEAYRRLVRFLDLDLHRYRELVQPRLGVRSATPSRRAAARTLASVLVSVATALAPIAPFTGESVVQTLQPGPRSLFESGPFDVDRAPPDETLAESWDRWLAVVRAAERFRNDRRLPPRSTLPWVALVVPNDELADRLRGEHALLERLAGIGRLEVGSPRSPWEGRRRQIVPVEGEVQRVYPAIAAQIVHLLRRMPPRKPGDLESARGFSVFVNGQPHQITAEMLTVVETLPERFVPTPFALGEMYAEVPTTGGPAAPRAPLALSADGAWLVRRVTRRLRSVGPETARSLSVRVLAVDPLAKELRERWAAVASALGVATLTIDAPPASGGAPPALVGRTRLGARWSVEITGLEAPPRGVRRPTPRAPPGSTRRMPVRKAKLVTGTPEVDFSQEQVIRHEEELRSLGEQLDQLLDAPLLGPAKVAYAWEAGFTSIDSFGTAPFDQLSSLPGFGRPLASRLFSKLGRTVPPPPPRIRTTGRYDADRARRTTAARGPAGAPPLGPTTGTPEGPERPMLAAGPTGETGGPALEPSAPIVGPVAEPPPGIGPKEAGPSPLPPRAEPGPLPQVPGVGAAIGPTPTSPSIPAPSVPPVREEAPRVPRVLPAPPAPPPPLEPAFVPESARPAPAAPASTPAPPAGLQVGLSEALLPALQPFLDATSAGHRGLAVVRELPERIRTLVGPRPVAVYWLSNLVRDRTIRPGDLAGLGSLIRQGIEANAITAIFLEGVEYLTRIHGSANVIAFLKEVDRQALEHGARVWLHLTPGLLSASDLELMLKELSPTDPAAPTGEGTEAPG